MLDKYWQYDIMIIGGDNYGCLYDDYFIFNTDNIRNNRNNKYDYIVFVQIN